ncbi:MAG TPA: hypothetical protein VFF82_10760 [Rhodocyclaceae bacterium]|nr:hypothetical protein [Rhodocyclaceae bacterium]
MIDTVVLGALNHLLGQAAWARQQLRGFAGRQARFEMSPWQLAFRVTADGLFEAAGDEAVDVTVVLPADTPFVALQGMDKAMSGAHVTGNAEFATALSFVLKNLRWDAEEDLSKLVGDIAAHRIGGGLSALTAWQKQAARNLAENVTEYLGEEAHLLATRPELTAFRADLEAFAADMSRLDVRVRALA